jgi:alpha-D-xyloside xylohydrolase
MAFSGHPIVRPFGLVYPHYNQHPADQYLLGEHLFVAPVITPGATTRALFMPPGKWLDWWTGAEIIGGADMTVQADLATLPLYLARGGIVPMLRETIDTLAATSDVSVDSFGNDTGVLVVRVAPGPEQTTFTLFDGSILTQSDSGSTLTFEPSMQPRFSGAVLFEVIATDGSAARRASAGRPVSAAVSTAASTTSRSTASVSPSRTRSNSCCVSVNISSTSTPAGTFRPAACCHVPIGSDHACTSNVHGPSTSGVIVAS